MFEVSFSNLQEINWLEYHFASRWRRLVISGGICWYLYSHTTYVVVAFAGIAVDYLVGASAEIGHI